MILKTVVLLNIYLFVFVETLQKKCKIKRKISLTPNFLPVVYINES